MRRILCKAFGHRPLYLVQPSLLHNSTSSSDVLLSFYGFCRCGKIWTQSTQNRWFSPIKTPGSSLIYYTDYIRNGRIRKLNSPRLSVDLDHLPEGSSGKWSVSIEEFTEKFVEARYAAYLLSDGEICDFSYPIGRYKTLRYGSQIQMVGCPQEVEEHRVLMDYISKLKGGVKILVLGLGLGITVELLKQYKNVRYIEVVERSRDVIKLVAPYVADSRVNIVHCDAFEYKPIIQFDATWVDLWSNRIPIALRGDIATFNRAELMAKLYSFYHKDRVPLCGVMLNWVNMFFRNEKEVNDGFRRLSL